MSSLFKTARNSNKLPYLCPNLGINDLLAQASLIETEIPSILRCISDQIRTPWQQRVLLQDFFVLFFVHKIKMACVIIREEFFANVWGPEICGGLYCASESRLKLAWMIHRSQVDRVALSSQKELLLRYWVKCPRDGLVEHSSVEPRLDIERLVKHKHQVLLADPCHCQQDITRKLEQRQSVHIHDGNPLLDVSLEKHALAHVPNHKRQHH